MGRPSSSRSVDPSLPAMSAARARRTYAPGASVTSSTRATKRLPRCSVRQRLPGIRPGLTQFDHTAAEPGHLVRHLDRHERRIVGIDRVEPEGGRLGVVAKCHGHRRCCLALVAGRIQSPHSQAPLTRRRDLHVEARKIGAHALTRDACRAAQAVASPDDGSAIALGGIGPGDREVVLIPPLVAALDADVDPAGRSVVDADRDRSRVADIAGGLLRLQEELLRPFRKLRSLDRDLAWSIRARDTVAEEILVRGGKRARARVSAD